MVSIDLLYTFAQSAYVSALLIAYKYSYTAILMLTQIREF